MAAATEGIGAGERSRAGGVLGAFGASVLLGLALLVFFEPDVQQADAAELVARSDDARAFFVADYVFIVLYGIVSPLAIRRYGAEIEGGPQWWVTAAVLLLPLAGVVDATENALLYSATDTISADTVDFAHALAIPKIVLFVAGAACAVAVVVRAIRALR
jgi:hypothetical protein